MVKITEEEFIGPNGEVRRTRKIESARARFEYANGTVEEYSDCTAEQWPYTPDGSPSEWKVFGPPIPSIIRRLKDIRTMILLWENGESILKLVAITIAAEFSQYGTDSLMGKEAPLEDRGDDARDNTTPL